MEQHTPAPDNAQVPQPQVPRPPVPPLPPAPQPETASPMVPAATFEKSPPLAALLSVIPSLGHLYVGAYQRAIMLVGSIFICIYVLPGLTKVFLPLFIWFFGFFDAYRLAQIANLGPAEPSPAPAPSTQGNLVFGVFVTVAGVVLLLKRLAPDLFDWLSEWWPAVLVVAGVILVLDSLRQRLSRNQTEPSEPLQ